MNNNLLQCYKRFSLFNLLVVFLLSGLFGTIFETIVTFVTSGGIIYKRFLFVLPVVYMFAISGGLIYLFGIVYNKTLKTLSIRNIIIYCVLSAIFLGAFEALCGTLLNNLGIEMWNYSWMGLCITNYTTLPIIFIWGILSTFCMLKFIPFIIRKTSKISKEKQKILIVIIIIVIVLDFVFSINHAYNDPQFMHNLVNP